MRKLAGAAVQRICPSGGGRPARSWLGSSIEAQPKLNWAAKAIYRTFAMFANIALARNSALRTCSLVSDETWLETLHAQGVLGHARWPNICPDWDNKRLDQRPRQGIGHPQCGLGWPDRGDPSNGSQPEDIHLKNSRP